MESKTQVTIVTSITTTTPELAPENGTPATSLPSPSGDRATTLSPSRPFWFGERRGGGNIPTPCRTPAPTTASRLVKVRVGEITEFRA